MVWGRLPVPRPQASEGAEATVLEPQARRGGVVHGGTGQVTNTVESGLQADCLTCPRPSLSQSGTQCWTPQSSSDDSTTTVQEKKRGASKRGGLCGEGRGGAMNKRVIVERKKRVNGKKYSQKTLFAVYSTLLMN